MHHTAFLESRRSFCKMQRYQSGRTVEPDQFLWLQHPDLCSGCQLIRQIPRNYEGRTFNSAFYCFKLWSACLHAFYYCTKHETDLTWLLVMGCLVLTWYCCVNAIGAAQTLALHWRVLFSHCCQIGGEREQCLAHPWSHSHQPKQVHCVRPVSHGEDHRREAQCGASSSHSLNIPTSLLSSLQIALHRQVNASSLTHNKCFNAVCMELLI